MAAPFAGAAMAAPGSSGSWTREAYLEAMRKSGRATDLSEAQFDAIQARKPAAMHRIEAY